MTGGGGKIYSTFGYVLKVEPTEFADSGYSITPQAHFPGTAAKLPQIFEIPPPICLALMMSSLHYTIHHIASSFADFCPGSYIAFDRAQECYSAAFCFLNLSFLSPLQGVPAITQQFSWIQGQQSSLASPHHHLILSVIPPPESRCLFPSDSAPSLNCFKLGWCNTFHTGFFVFFLSES